MGALINTVQTVIAEKDNKDYWFGRDMYHRAIAFPPIKGIKIGQKINVKIDHIMDNQLIGTIQ